MTQKQKIKERIRLSNEMVANGLPPDPWVVEFRKKNNAIKARWKAVQPKKEPKPRKLNSGCFKQGLVPWNKGTEDQRRLSEEKWREGTRKWHKENRDRINKRRRELRQSNPSFKLANNLRKRLSYLVRKHNTSKTKQTFALLGCSMDEFMNYLQSKFRNGMSFENYGQWHIDHVIPCDAFDLTIPENQEKCFHYTNLQPLWALENRIKSNKVEYA